MLFALGVMVYHVIIRRIIRAPMLSQIFTTFGIDMILFRGLAQFFWKPDFRSVDHSIVQGQFAFAGLQFGLPQLIAGAGAIIVTGVVWWFLQRTRLGAALEATAADKEAAALMGINVQKMFALAWGIGAACAGVAGALLSTFLPYYFPSWREFLLIAFVTVALGGFGSVAGAFWAGIIVGIVEVLGGFLLGRSKLALVLALFLLVCCYGLQVLLGRA